MKAQIQISYNKRFALKIEPNESIVNIKRMIQDKEDVSHYKQHLFLLHRELDDEWILSSLIRGSELTTLHLRLQMRKDSAFLKNDSVSFTVDNN